eukprot:PLAT16114.2.p1 GENE.PLAT16114.2~~PLAT16114.2.p1  ORF type:complete len:1508 (-),score=740.12 PLAT16114.2:116-4639(-)
MCCLRAADELEVAARTLDRKLHRRGCARLIQRAWRACLRWRVEKYAVRLQKHVRAMLARQHVGRLRRRARAARSMQRMGRAWLWRRHRAASRLQLWWLRNSAALRSRRFQAIRRQQQHERELACAHVIKRFFRRCRWLWSVHRMVYALRIQRCWRGYSARQQLRARRAAVRRATCQRLAAQLTNSILGDGLQRTLLANLGRRMHAARILQRTVLAFMARIRFRRGRKRYFSALTLQSAWRCYVARRELAVRRHFRHRQLTNPYRAETSISALRSKVVADGGATFDPRDEQRGMPLGLWLRRAGLPQLVGQALRAAYIDSVPAVLALDEPLLRSVGVTNDDAVRRILALASGRPADKAAFSVLRFREDVTATFLRVFPGMQRRAQAFAGQLAEGSVSQLQLMHFLNRFSGRPAMAREAVSELRLPVAWRDDERARQAATVELYVWALERMRDLLADCAPKLSAAAVTAVKRATGLRPLLAASSLRSALERLAAMDDAARLLQRHYRGYTARKLAFRMREARTLAALRARFSKEAKSSRVREMWEAGRATLPLRGTVRFGWYRALTDDGVPYYVEEATGETAWEAAYTTAEGAAASVLQPVVRAWLARRHAAAAKQYEKAREAWERSKARTVSLRFSVVGGEKKGPLAGPARLRVFWRYSRSSCLRYGWRRIVKPEQSLVYYANAKLRKTSWDAPLYSFEAELAARTMQRYTRGLLGRRRYHARTRSLHAGQLAVQLIAQAKSMGYIGYGLEGMSAVMYATRLGFPQVAAVVADLQDVQALKALPDKELEARGIKDWGTRARLSASMKHEGQFLPEVRDAESIMRIFLEEFPSQLTRAEPFATPLAEGARPVTKGLLRQHFRLHNGKPKACLDTVEELVNLETTSMPEEQLAVRNMLRHGVHQIAALFNLWGLTPQVAKLRAAQAAAAAEGHPGDSACLLRGVLDEVLSWNESACVLQQMQRGRLVRTKWKAVVAGLHAMVIRVQAGWRGRMARRYAAYLRQQRDSVWQEQWDPSVGRYFYYNSETKETSWHYPDVPARPVGAWDYLQVEETEEEEEVDVPLNMCQDCGIEPAVRLCLEHPAGECRHATVAAMFAAASGRKKRSEASVSLAEASAAWLAGGGSGAGPEEDDGPSAGEAALAALRELTGAAEEAELEAADTERKEEDGGGAAGDSSAAMHAVPTQEELDDAEASLRGRRYCFPCYALAHAHDGEASKHAFESLVALPSVKMCCHCGDELAAIKCLTCGDFFCRRDYFMLHPKGVRDHRWRGFLPGSAVCVTCEAEIATRSCEECGDNYCGPCSYQLHLRGGRSEHSVSIIKEPLESGDVYCEECHTRVAWRRCRQCNGRFCDSCADWTHGRGCNPRGGQTKKRRHCVQCGERAVRECIECGDSYCNRAGPGNPGCHETFHASGARASHSWRMLPALPDSDDEDAPEEEESDVGDEDDSVHSGESGRGRASAARLSAAASSAMFGRGKKKPVFVAAGIVDEEDEDDDADAAFDAALDAALA